MTLFVKWFGRANTDSVFSVSKQRTRYSDEVSQVLGGGRGVPDSHVGERAGADADQRRCDRGLRQDGGGRGENEQRELLRPRRAVQRIRTPAPTYPAPYGFLQYWSHPQRYVHSLFLSGSRYITFYPNVGIYQTVLVRYNGVQQPPLFLTPGQPYLLTLSSVGTVTELQVVPTDSSRQNALNGGIYIRNN